MLLMLAVPPQPLPPARVFKLEGSWAFLMERAKKRAMAEMPGATVVVEEDFLPPMAKKELKLELGNGWFRLGQKAVPRGPSHTDLPKWMDPNFVISGGNVVHRNYPMGWGY